MDDAIFRPPKLRRLFGFMTVLFSILLLVEVALPIILYLSRDRMMFFPSAEPSPEVGLQFLLGSADLELLRISRPDGRQLAAYDARPINRHHLAEPLLIFFHGNAGNIGARAPLVEEFVHQTGVRTILPDYSGYGGNEGSPTEQEVYQDGLAIYDHFIEQGISSDRIVLYGESLGGAVALFVATQRPSAGLVLQSTFSSVSSMTRQLYPWLPLSPLLTRDVFPSIERIGILDTPMLIVHGKNDRIVPVSEGRKLHRVAHREAEFLVIEGAGHNDLLDVAGPDYFNLISERVRQWTSGLA